MFRVAVVEHHVRGAPGETATQPAMGLFLGRRKIVAADRAGVGP